ncbi:MAG: hypothetical protein KAT28_03655 [Candidatus Aenigmarchaeota archaeon]|nr:hypothetical protein [Candidatus Aenigmarchaeota archaeon]
MVTGIIPEELRREVICPIDGTKMEYHTQYHNERWYNCPTCGFDVDSDIAKDSDELYYKARDYIVNNIELKILTGGELDLRISEMRDSNEKYKKFVKDFGVNYKQRMADSVQESRERHPENYIDC